MLHKRIFNKFNQHIIACGAFMSLSSTICPPFTMVIYAPAQVDPDLPRGGSQGPLQPFFTTLCSVFHSKCCTTNITSNHILIGFIKNMSNCLQKSYVPILVWFQKMGWLNQVFQNVMIRFLWLWVTMIDSSHVKWRSL